MKKTNSKKLSLNLQTIRTLTGTDLNLVVGGVCQHGSDPSVIAPPPDRGNGGAGGGNGGGGAGPFTTSC